MENVNEISGRKSSISGKLKANNQEERLQLWKKHFENLLGRPLNVNNETIIPLFLEELQIKKGNFTIDEKVARLADWMKIQPKYGSCLTFTNFFYSSATKSTIRTP